MYASALYSRAEPEIAPVEVAIFIAFLFAGLLLIYMTAAAFLQFRKIKLATDHQDELYRLVGRYEQLAENTMDTQQRMAVDLADLRARAASIEKILRTVE